MTPEVEARLKNVTILVLGMLDKMRDAGLVRGSSFRLSEEGQKRYLAILDENFIPTENEIVKVLDQLNAICGLQVEPEAKAEIERLEERYDSHTTKN